MIDAVIASLRARCERVPVPLTLPDDEDLLQVEEALNRALPRDLRHFLSTVSDVVYGHLEPVTASDPRAHTWLPDMAAQAWDRGLPRHLLPLCERATGYDCIAPGGEILCWRPEEGLSELAWPSIWHWAREVWLQQAELRGGAEG